MKFVFLMLAGFAALIWWMLMGEPNYKDELLAHFPMNEVGELSPSIERYDVRIDPIVSTDGGGSLRIEAETPTFLELAKVYGNGEDLSFKQLMYEAKIKTEGASGPVFLVMQAGVAGAPGGSMPVIGRDKAITGTNDWTTLQLAAGNGRGALHTMTTLQLEIQGAGTIWVDDVRLVSRQAY